MEPLKERVWKLSNCVGVFLGVVGIMVGFPLTLFRRYNVIEYFIIDTLLTLTGGFLIKTHIPKQTEVES